MYGEIILEKVILIKDDCENFEKSIDRSVRALYISDGERICEMLRNEGMAVAGLLTSDNAEYSFLGTDFLIEDYEELELEDFDHIYRRICGLPCDILETDRLYLRETTVEDVDRFLELYADSDITRYMEDLFEADKEREYQANYIKNIYGFYDCGIWTMILKGIHIEENEHQKECDEATLESADIVIGRMGIEMTDEKGTAEMGFMLGKPYWGCGYATEAGRAVLEYAFTLPGIERVRARVHKDNKESINLCERLGMKETISFRDADQERIFIIESKHT